MDTTMIDNLDDKISHAYALLAEKCKAPKSPSDWGIRFYDDTPIAGNPASFAWLSSLQEVLEFVLECLCFYKLDPSITSVTALLEKISNFSNSTLCEEIDIETYVQKSNNELAKMCQIVWIGTLEDLMQGGGEFSTEMRTEYWERTEKEGHLDKISAEELEEFIAYLEEYDL